MDYTYPVKTFNGALLDQQLKAIALYVFFSIETITDPYTFQQIVVHCSAPADKSALDTIIANHDATQKTADQQTTATTAANTASARQLVVNAATSAVGVNITALTAAQVRALCACLLWKAGGIDQNGVVQPLASWL